MSVQGLNDAIARMREDGMSEVAITAFTHNYHQWESDRSGFIAEENVKPLKQLPAIGDVMGTISPEDAHDALAHTAFLKLNGGLGTSMGLSKAKSLLPVRLHKGRPMRFLDIILGQVVATRSAQGVDLPLVFMNSYRTSKDTLQVIRRNRHFKQTDIPVEILQHREPKILAETGEPVSWPENPDLETCMPRCRILAFSIRWRRQVFATCLSPILTIWEQGRARALPATLPRLALLLWLRLLAKLKLT